MGVTRQKRLPLAAELDLVKARQAVREWAAELKFSLVDQTKIVTAASELARNTIVYGGGGQMQVVEVEDRGRKGLQLIFEDSGPGIPDIELAMQDGYTTGSGLGLGLGGAKRLMNDFCICSELGRGTRITVTRWR